LSGGRLILGVGVGTLAEEFALLGADFAGRGARYEEALLALRAALGRRKPTFRGEFFAFDDFIVDPCAAQAHVPIWLGGRTPRSLRRALELGDGWVPFGLSLEELAQRIAAAKESSAWRERERPFEVALALEAPLDLDRPAVRDATIDAVARTQAAGASI